MAFRRFDTSPPSKKDTKRIIDRPSDRQIRLIGDDGQQVGVLTEREALLIAGEKGLDLVEIAPHLDPPTCKIMDWGRHQYQSTKKQHRAKKSSKKRKEIQLRPKTEKHDLDTKLRHARRFLEAGHKVLVSLIFRGRELRYVDENTGVLDQFANELEGVAKVERSAKRESRNRVTMILGPKQGTPP
jgi:translation initiation factor IF-3